MCAASSQLFLFVYQLGLWGLTGFVTSVLPSVIWRGAAEGPQAGHIPYVNTVLKISFIK